MRIHRDRLIESLSELTPATQARGPAPNYALVWLSCRLSIATFRASTDTITGTLTVPAHGDLDECAVPLRDLIVAVKGFPAEDLSLHLVGHRLEIRAPSMTRRMHVTGAEFMSRDLLALEPSFSCRGDMLAAALAAVHPAADQTGARIGMNGVHLEPYTDGDVSGVRLVATDGHRLVLRDVPLESPMQARPVKSLIPPAACVAICRTLSPDVWSVEIRPGVLRLRGDGADWMLGMYDGEFPDYKAVIPRDQPVATITVNAAALSAAMSAAMTITGSVAVHATVMHIRQESEVVVAASVDGADVRVAVPLLDSAGRTDMTIGVSSRYMLDAIHRLGSEVATFEFFGPLSPIIVRQAGALEILMTMRLTDYGAAVDLAGGRR